MCLFHCSPHHAQASHTARSGNQHPTYLTVIMILALLEISPTSGVLSCHLLAPASAVAFPVVLSMAVLARKQRQRLTVSLRAVAALNSIDPSSRWPRLIGAATRPFLFGRLGCKQLLARLPLGISARTRAQGVAGHFLW